MIYTSNMMILKLGLNKEAAHPRRQGPPGQPEGRRGRREGPPLVRLDRRGRVPGQAEQGAVGAAAQEQHGHLAVRRGGGGRPHGQLSNQHRRYVNLK